MMNLLSLIGLNPVNGFFALSGIILFIVTIFLIRKSFKNTYKPMVSKDNGYNFVEKDVLGMDKNVKHEFVQEETTVESKPTLLNWRFILLILLLIGSLFLIYQGSSVIAKDTDSKPTSEIVSPQP